MLSLRVSVKSRAGAFCTSLRGDREDTNIMKPWITVSK